MPGCVGAPSGLLPVVIALEVLGGLAVIVGWQKRIAFFLLAGFCLLAAAMFYNNFGDQNEMIHFMKDIAMAGGFLFLTAHAAGNFSPDKRT